MKEENLFKKIPKHLRIRKSLGIKEDNFTYVARNITKFYLELSKDYKECFRDEVSLLTAVGVLDAQIYIFSEGSISISEIEEIAQKSVTSEEDPLMEFIINLETLIFKIDMPLMGIPMSISRIRESCLSQRERIKQVVDLTKQEYKGELIFKELVDYFMISPEFEDLRKELNIKTK